MLAEKWLKLFDIETFDDFEESSRQAPTVSGIIVAGVCLACFVDKLFNYAKKNISDNT